MGMSFLDLPEKKRDFLVFIKAFKAKSESFFNSLERIREERAGEREEKRERERARGRMGEKDNGRKGERGRG